MNNAINVKLSVVLTKIKKKSLSTDLIKSKLRTDRLVTVNSQRSFPTPKIAGSTTTTKKEKQ